jgi:peptidoglycan-associated lipoprotein
MMIKTLTAGLLTCLILVGCSETPSKDAPIVDRSGAAVSTSGAGSTQAEAATVNAGAAGSPAGTAGAGGDQAGTSASATTQAGAAPGGVETRALPAGQVQGVSATSMAADKAGEGKNPLKDPGSILSKRTIYFDFDSSDIRDEFRPLVEAHAQYLKDNKQAKVILQGHTDERGSREYNIALGQRRAESVSKAMALLGVPETQVEAVSMGEEKPAVEGHDEAAWKMNRRVEILYQGE